MMVYSVWIRGAKKYEWAKYFETSSFEDALRVYMSLASCYFPEVCFCRKVSDSDPSEG